MTPVVVCSDEQDVIAVDVDRLAMLATRVLQHEGVSGELTLTFIDRDEMTALNIEHMGGDGPTDVLSFPLDEHDPPPVAAPSADESTASNEVPVLLGDVVVCPEIAAGAAADHAGSVDDELALLVVHGILHVLGHDHREPGETQVMRSRELELLETLHWNGPAPAGFSQDPPGTPDERREFDPQ